ncbi:hypothetical protein PL75_10090 [Neisseria arctica]|uniref:Uncharacterized protein n=2 Tax=Neisseria arctica TaxID=1470200 RepID=A0A0J0YPN2_9NEIS|nr:hypothetical protein PL75_10090 [Neisseria arctica]
MKMKQSKTVVKLTNVKRLLRVRGLEEIENLITEKESQLLKLMDDARNYCEECKKYDFVYTVTYVGIPIKAKTIPAAKRKILQVPEVKFRKYIMSNSRGTVSERRDINTWDELSAKLDETNASLEERQIHMFMFIQFKVIYAQARVVAQELVSLYGLKSDRDDMFEFESMKVSAMPKIML